MSSSAASDLDNLPPGEMEIIDSACDGFERAWRNGQSPSLENFVKQAPEKLKKLLLQELLAIELPYRRQLGQAITSEDYAFRFSDLDVRLFRQINAKASEAARQAAMNGLLSPLSDPQSGNCVLGDFRLIKEVGRGGMGIVYAAEQISLGRQVALKALPSSQRLSSKHLQRFQNEARAAASLQHPNIVPVFAVGAEQGIHYYAMQLIDGPTLAEVVEENTHRSDPPFVLLSASNESNPWKTTASLKQPSEVTQRMRSIALHGIQAAEALEHAHSMGIVHRDVKPGNLMLDQSGKLWVTDFGLARIEADVNLTLTGVAQQHWTCRTNIGSLPSGFATLGMGVPEAGLQFVSIRIPQTKFQRPWCAIHSRWQANRMRIWRRHDPRLGYCNWRVSTTWQSQRGDSLSRFQ